MFIQWCLTLCNLMDCSLPGPSIHGIFQARIPWWVAILFSRGSSWPRDRKPGSPLCRQIHYPLSHQGSPIIILKTDTEYFRQLIFKTEQCGQLKGTTCEKDRSPLSILSKKALVQNLNSFKSIKTLIWVQADMSKIIQVTLFYKNAIWDLFGSSL